MAATSSGKSILLLTRAGVGIVEVWAVLLALWVTVAGIIASVYFLPFAPLVWGILLLHWLTCIHSTGGSPQYLQPLLHSMKAAVLQKHPERFDAIPGSINPAPGIL